jgi:nicotinamide mononucleotide adenylyltransferase
MSGIKNQIPKSIGYAGLIGRFKPLHNGALIMLQEACKRADFLKIGIGSSNKYDVNNPFTAQESQEMIDLVLSPTFSNYEIMQIEDFAHIPKYHDGQKWKEHVLDKFGSLDYFISSNPYVENLLCDSYTIIPAFELVPTEKRTNLKATHVRVEIARFGNWEKMVPKPVAKYLKENGIIERFRKEFGLPTLGRISEELDYNPFETIEQEKKKAEKK